jgi:hypothetical protein
MKWQHFIRKRVVITHEHRAAVPGLMPRLTPSFPQRPKPSPSFSDESVENPNLEWRENQSRTQNGGGSIPSARR